MDKRSDRSVVFQPLDRDAEILVTERNLPHWYQAGVAIFLTFRTADSMPAEVILRWQRELQDWLAPLALPLSLAESVAGPRVPNHDELWLQLSAVQQREFKRLRDRIFHRSLDQCHGACWLRKPELAVIVADAIRCFDGDRYDLDCFVVMPNHVHAIVQFRPGFDLVSVSQSWLRYSARQINKVIGASGAFWQPEPLDHLIRSAEQFEYLQRYIAENPAKARLPPSDFLYWRRRV